MKAEIQSLQSLIDQAKAKDPFFKRRIEYRISGRTHPKPPDLDWLMNQLEKILGKKYVEEEAQKYVDSIMEKEYAVDSNQGTKAESKEPEQA